MTLRLRVHPAGPAVTVARGETVHVGRDASNEVQLGDERVHGRWTVSKRHARIEWDGSRWSTVNVSDKTGLLRVYEPGFDDVPLESGRPWAPLRHRWCLGFGRPGHVFSLVCDTDDHAPTDGRDPLHTVEPHVDAFDDDDPTAAIDFVTVTFTDLERETLIAYYEDFTRLPRPGVLEPRSHDDAAHRLGRSRDSTRKAIERINEKIGRTITAPAIATGRNVSPEIGRWLAATGLIDPPTPAT